jgi:hypothetical protein
MNRRSVMVDHEEIGKRISEVGENTVQGRYGRDSIDLDALREDLEEILDDADEAYPEHGPDDKR